MSFILSPSLLSANFLHLEKEIEMLNRSLADRLHLDLMDGIFVPNISMGFSQIKLLSKIFSKPLDAHLMLIEPQKFITQFRDFGIQTLLIHYEVCSTHLHRTIEQIKQAGMQVGVAINPHTPVEILIDILENLDRVLILSVNPGFGGQAFISHSINKVVRLKKIITVKNLSTLIEIDGGINLKIGQLLLGAGADMLVVGNSIFRAQSPINMIKQIKNL